jgi:hypothetical protein
MTADKKLSLTIAQLKARHPMPWRIESVGNGIMRVLDETGHEVELMTMLDFLESITRVLAAKKAG